MPAGLFTDPKEMARLMNLPGVTPEKWTKALTRGPLAQGGDRQGC